MADASLTHGVWLERVPELVTECAEQWGLRLDGPYQPGVAGHVVRVELPDGTPAVLKLIYPHREAEHEAEALTVWDGDGAVRLFEHDEERWAMLVERCEPGTHLARLGADAALDVIVGLLPRLWKPAGEPFRPLAEEAAWWASYLPSEWERTGRQFERHLLDTTAAALLELSATQGEHVDRLTSELGLDRERARWWTIGQTLAWSSLDGTFLEGHLQTMRRLLEAA